MTFSRGGLHAALLALALLAAQALGLAHRVAHGLPQVPGGGAAGMAAMAPVAAKAAAIDTEEALAELFSAHDPGGAECRLLDQAAHADVLAAAAWPALPPRVPTALPPVADTILAGVGVHAYLARGPPAGLRKGLRAAWAPTGAPGHPERAGRISAFARLAGHRRALRCVRAAPSRRLRWCGGGRA